MTTSIESKNNDLGGHHDYGAGRAVYEGNLRDEVDYCTSDYPEEVLYCADYRRCSSVSIRRRRGYLGVVDIAAGGSFTLKRE